MVGGGREEGMFNCAFSDPPLTPYLLMEGRREGVDGVDGMTSEYSHSSSEDT